MRARAHRPRRNTRSPTPAASASGFPECSAASQRLPPSRAGPTRPSISICRRTPAAEQNFVTSSGMRGSVVSRPECACRRACSRHHLHLGIAGARRPGCLHACSPLPEISARGSTPPLTGPLGNTISGSKSDNRITLSDVFYQGTLKWNQGVNNEMVYITGNIPSGTYDPNRLANLSFGFVARRCRRRLHLSQPEDAATSSRLSPASPTISRTPICSTRTASTSIVDWAARNSSARACSSAWPAITSSSSPTISGPGATLGGFRGAAVGIGPQIGFLFPRRRLSGLSQPEGLQGFRGREPAEGLDHLGDLRDLAEGARAAAIGDADRSQILSENAYRSSDGGSFVQRTASDSGSAFGHRSSRCSSPSCCSSA